MLQKSYFIEFEVRNYNLVQIKKNTGIPIKNLLSTHYSKTLALQLQRDLQATYRKEIKHVIHKPITWLYYREFLAL